MTSIIEIAKEIQRALGFLYSVGDIAAFARSIGYDFEPVAGALTNVQTRANNLVTDLDDLDSAVNHLLDLNNPFGADAQTALLEFIRAIDSIAATHSALKSVGESFSEPRLSTHISEIMGGAADAQSQFASEFLDRTVGIAVHRYLEREHPVAEKILEIVDVLQSVERTVDPATHRLAFTEYKVNWQGIADFLSDPADYIQTLYRWGIDAQALNSLLDRFQWLLISKMIPASVVYATQTEQSEFESIIDGNFPANVTAPRSLKVLLWEDQATGLRIEIQVLVIPATVPGLGFALFASVNDRQEIYLTDNLVLIFDGGASLDAGLYLAFMPGATPAFSYQLPDPSLIRTSLEIKTVRRSTTESSPLLGSVDGSRLEIGGVNGLVGVEIVKDQPPDLFGEIQLSDGRVIIKTGEGDGFIQKVLPDLNVDAAFDIVIGWSTKRGLYLRGSGSIEIIIPIHQSIGPINIQTIYLGLAIPEQGDIPITVAVTASVELGPIKGRIDRIGLLARYSFPEGGGNKGPLQLDLSFKAPTGASLAIEAGPIVGGGFLGCYPEEERYAGILQLNMGEIGLTAIGLITTRMPDGSKGFSLLISIGVEFTPAIQISFGFTLSAVGGLVGINREMLIDVLRAGVRNRTLDSILFPVDPIANAPKIISDLRAVFPPEEDRFVVGPMLRIGWGSPTIITAEFGVFIALPSPVRIAILGQFAAILPDETIRQIELHVDVLGTIDFEKKALAIDASLYDSRVLELPLSGDAAVRLGWGDRPYFGISLGGFHPRFAKPPQFPNLRRLCLSIGSGNNPRLTCGMYMALTSNSLQFGALVELNAKACGCKVHGYMGFDALFYFSPFGFDVAIKAGVSITYKGYNLMAIRLSLQLAGTTPWHAEGEASFEILLWEIDVHFSKTWGKREKKEPPAVNLWNDFVAALERPESWGTKLPDGRFMVESLRSIERAEGEETYLFSIEDGALKEKLNDEDGVPEELKEMFRTKGIPVSETATVMKYNGDKWEITDEEKNYFIRKEGEKLNIYEGITPLLAHPAGTLEVRQKVLPLDMRLSQYGNAPIAGYHTYGIEPSEIGSDFSVEDLKDYFARGQYEKLSDTEKLSKPSFELLKNGIAFKAKSVQFDKDRTQTYELTYESEYIDDEYITYSATKPGKARIAGTVVRQLLVGAASRKSALRTTGLKKYERTGVAARVSVGEEGYTIVRANNMTAVAEIEGNNGAMSRMAADQALRDTSEAQLGLKEELLIVPSYEVAA